MKKKGLYLLFLLLVFIVSVMADSQVHENVKRYHQHRETVLPPCNQEEEFCTHLPLVLIDTLGQTIPGDAILDEDKNVIDYTMAKDGNSTIEAQIQLMDSPKNHHPSDPADLESLVRIRKRGNSSRMFDKKSYQIELVDESGNEADLPVMGMEAHSDWALYGPFLDKTMLRNYMLLNVSGEIMDAPDVRYCEVFLDGEYQGLYVMMETIARSEGRVNVSKYKDGQRSFSYILKLDRDQDTQKSLNQFSYYSFITEYKTTLEVVYPAAKDLTPEVTDAIEDEISRFEKSLFSYDFKDPVLGYEKYIDVDSFVDYYILMEFLCVNDMCSRSTYLYKDAKGKLTMGPLWDMNNALNNFIALDFDGLEIYFVDRTWYKMLMRDEAFVKRVINRYRELRTTVLSEEYLLDYIDDTVTYLGDAVDRNYKIWGYSFDPENVSSFARLRPVQRNPENFESSIMQLKEFIKVRGRYLDRNIETLYQYCHESKNKQFEE